MAETNNTLLIDAFAHFMQASSSLESQYQELQQHTQQLSIELEQVNLDLKRSLGEKEQVQSYLTNILQSLTRGVLVVDLAGKVVLCNPAASEQLGVELIPESSIQSALRSHPFLTQVCTALCEPGLRVEDVELDLEQNDQIRSLSVGRTPVYNESKTCIGISFILSDITQIRALERENRRREWLSAIGEMALELSQQINQPLGNIDQAANLLKDRFAEYDEKHFLAEEISSGVHSLNDVVAKLKALSGRARQTIVGAADTEIPVAKTRTARSDRRASGRSKHTIITGDPTTLQLLEIAAQIAGSRTTVLLQAESGTGKELLSRYIHEHSPRATKPFIAVNCAAVPEPLLESELFGHEKGAFTGASSQKIGKFEAANGGTILLDEISEMPLMLQAKLLRVLQEQEIDRVGGLKPINIDVRIIATTNRRLLDQVRTGTFREDLYYRLNVVPLELPPLRERIGDVGLLAEHFCQRYAQEMLDGSVALSSAAMEILVKHRWPGNVRELENVIQRAVALSQNSIIEPGDLMLTALTGPMTGSLSNRFEACDLTMDDAERELIFRTLAELDGNRTHAAKKLGISLRTLRNRLRDYRDQGMNVPPPSVKILPTGNSMSA